MRNGDWRRIAFVNRSPEREYLPPTPWLWIRRGIFLVVLLVSLVLLFSPATPNSPDPPISDKVIHALIFLTLGVTALAARLGPWGLALVGLAAYAAGSEVLQGVLPIGRDGSWGDLAADLVGLILAFGLVWLLAPRSSANRAQR